MTEVKENIYCKKEREREREREILIHCATPKNFANKYLTNVDDNRHSIIKSMKERRN